MRSLIYYVCIADKMALEVAYMPRVTCSGLNSITLLNFRIDIINHEICLTKVLEGTIAILWNYELCIKNIISTRVKPDLIY